MGRGSVGSGWNRPRRKRYARPLLLFPLRPVPFRRVQQKAPHVKRVARAEEIEGHAIAGVSRYADLRLLGNVVVRADTAFEIISGVVLLSVQGVHLPQPLQRAAVGVKVEISADHGGRGLEILPHPIEIEIVGVDAIFVRAAIVDQQVDAALSQREGSVVRCCNVKDLRLCGQAVDVTLIKLNDCRELVLHHIDVA